MTTTASVSTVAGPDVVPTITTVPGTSEDGTLLCPNHGVASTARSVSWAHGIRPQSAWFTLLTFE